MSSPRLPRTDDADLPVVVLLHGWPGLPSDYRLVTPRLRNCRILVPGLRGLGEEFRGPIDVADATADAHAARLLAYLDAQGVRSGAIVAGYDIGSRIAQSALRADPDRFSAAVITPGYPGIGARAADPTAASVFWYQHFHRTDLAIRLIDGQPRQVETYIQWAWDQWRGRHSEDAHPNRDELRDAYARPGAFHASIRWYEANRGYAGTFPPISVPTTMVWPASDPLFPLSWSDEVSTHFTHSTLEILPDCGHFVPVERPDLLARAIQRHIG